MIKKCFISMLLSYSTLTFCQIEMFEKGLISNDDAFGLSLSVDGNELLYVKAYGGRDSLRLFHSKKINGIWQQPIISPFFEKGVNQIDPSYSPDGKSILINALVKEKNGYDVYMINREESGWSEPILLSENINTEAHEFYATMTLSKDIYFTRRNESNDIYVSQWNNGAYQKSIPISENINTENSESNPYISPNGDYLIFISNREGGYGNADLYITFLKNERWSHPLNLGPMINTADSEFCPSIDFLNQRFYFAKTIRDGDNRIENIFSIPLSDLKIKDLKIKAKWE